MIEIVRLTLAALAVVFISGCASVTRGRKDTLVVESIPAGADVRLSTGGVGKTPTSFQLPRKNALDVYIEKEGYESLSVHVSSQISGKGSVGLAGNALIGGIIGVGIDSYTGAAKDLRPNPIKVTLVPVKREPEVAAVVAEGAGTPPTGGAGGGGPELVPAGTEVGLLYLPGRPDPVRTKELIVGVLQGREWEVADATNDHVVGHIKHRSSEANLSLVFDAKEIRLFCEGWKIDKKTGAHLKPELPDGWIENIKSDLRAKLGQGPVGR